MSQDIIRSALPPADEDRRVGGGGVEGYVHEGAGSGESDAVEEGDGGCEGLALGGGEGGGVVDCVEWHFCSFGLTRSLNRRFVWVMWVLFWGCFSGVVGLAQKKNFPIFGR